MLTFLIVLAGLVIATLIAIVVNLLTPPGGHIDKRLLAALGVLLVTSAVVVTWDRSRTAEDQSRNANPIPITSTAPTPTPTSSAPTSTSKAPNVTASETSAITSAATSGAGRTYIEDMKYTQEADPYDTRDTANINGQAYPHSQGAKFCPNSERNWEYDLGRAYSEFHAIIGLNDYSPSKAVVRYELIADGEIIFSQDVQFGESFAVDRQVEDVLRLQMVTTLLSQTCRAATAQWGEVYVQTT